MQSEVFMIRTTALLVMAALLCVACGSDSTTGPTPTSFAGTWNGTVADSLCGNGIFQGVLAQSGSSVTGTGSVVFTRAGCGGIRGSLNGTVSGASLQATLQSSDPQYCSLALSVAVSGSTITGTYAAANCSYTQTGNVSATR